MVCLLFPVLFFCQRRKKKFRLVCFLACFSSFLSCFIFAFLFSFLPTEERVFRSVCFLPCFSSFLSFPVPFCVLLCGARKRVGRGRSRDEMNNMLVLTYSREKHGARKTIKIVRLVRIAGNREFEKKKKRCFVLCCVFFRTCQVYLSQFVCHASFICCCFDIFRLFPPCYLSVCTCCVSTCCLSVCLGCLSACRSTYRSACLCACLSF